MVAKGARYACDLWSKARAPAICGCQGVSDNERRFLILLLDASTALALSGLIMRLLMLVTNSL